MNMEYPNQLSSESAPQTNEWIGKGGLLLFTEHIRMNEI